MLSAELQAQLTKPYLQIPAIKTPPAIDGKLSPGEWKNATLVSDYEVWTLDAYVPDKVETYVGYDSKYIYVSFKGFFPIQHFSIQRLKNTNQLTATCGVAIILAFR